MDTIRKEIRKEINRLGFNSNEKTSLHKYFTDNVERINVALSFLPDYGTDDEGKRGYLKSLISTPGMLHSCPHRVIFANNTDYLPIVVLFLSCFLSSNPPKKH